MKNSLYRLITLILLCIVISWNLYFADKLSLHLNNSEWVPYLFSTPIVYYAIISFSKSIDKKTKMITLILAGIITSILLDNDLYNSLHVQKILASIVGAVCLWLVGNVTKAK